MLRLRPLTIMTRRFIWHDLMVHPILRLISCDDFGWRIYARTQIFGSGLDFGGHGFDGLLGLGDGYPVAIVNRNVEKPSIS